MGSDIDGVVSNTNEYALYLKLADFEIDGFLHSNDLTFTGNQRRSLKNTKKGIN